MKNGLALPFRGQRASQTMPAPAEVERHPSGPARSALLKAHMTASYQSTRAIPHASLGVSAYVQFTSPIRRDIHPSSAFTVASNIQFSL